MLIKLTKILISLAMIARYGGEIFWEYIVENLQEKIKNDLLLRNFFENKSEGDTFIILFNILRAGLGDDSHFYEEAVREAHRDKGITSEQFNRFLNSIRTVLNEEEVEAHDIDIIIGRLSKFSHLVISNNH